MDYSLSITELSRLTNKTRPTIYKYIKCFNNKQYDEVPYSFIKLFELCKNPHTSKSKIIEYCKNNFTDITTEESDLCDFISFIKTYKNQIDFEKVKKFILEEMNDETSKY